MHGKQVRSEQRSEEEEEEDAIHSITSYYTIHTALHWSATAVCPFEMIARSSVYLSFFPLSALPLRSTFHRDREKTPAPMTNFLPTIGRARTRRT